MRRAPDPWDIEVPMVLICAPFQPGVIQAASLGPWPTVHRSGEHTIMENLRGLESEFVSARRAVGQGRLYVGPIGLVARHGPFPDGPGRADGLPATVDPRQTSLLAAAWTVRVLAVLPPGHARCESIPQHRGSALPCRRRPAPESGCLRCGPHRHTRVSPTAPAISRSPMICMGPLRHREPRVTPRALRPNRALGTDFQR